MKVFNTLLKRFLFLTPLIYAPKLKKNCEKCNFRCNLVAINWQRIKHLLELFWDRNHFFLHEFMLSFWHSWIFCKLNHALQKKVLKQLIENVSHTLRSLIFFLNDYITKNPLLSEKNDHIHRFFLSEYDCKCGKR